MSSFSGVRGDAGQGVDHTVVGTRRASGLLADLGRDGAACGDVELVDHGRFTGDGHLALDCRLQRQVEVLPVAGSGVELGRGLAQALQFGLQAVRAGHDADKAELAVLVRDGELVATLTGQGDADARKRRASRVNDRAADGRGLRCVGEGRRTGPATSGATASRFMELLLGSSCRECEKRHYMTGSERMSRTGRIRLVGPCGSRRLDRGCLSRQVARGW